jgi:hypothetical protein
MEERRVQQPDLVDAARAAQEAAETTAAPALGARRRRKKRSEKERLASTKAGRRVLREMGQEAFEAMDREGEEEESKPDTEDMEPAYMLDAFFFGNVSRVFLCCGAFGPRSSPLPFPSSSLFPASPFDLL